MDDWIVSRDEILCFTLHPPAQHAQDQIHHKERPEDDHGDEVHELPGAALGVVDLKYQVRSSREFKKGK